MRLGELNYFQMKGGQEIDFILNKQTAVEVKETPVPQDLHTLGKRAAALGLPDAWLIGRRPPQGAFDSFIWGGTLF